MQHNSQAMYSPWLLKCIRYAVEVYLSKGRMSPRAMQICVPIWCGMLYLHSLVEIEYFLKLVFFKTCVLVESCIIREFVGLTEDHWLAVLLHFQ